MILALLLTAMTLAAQVRQDPHPDIQGLAVALRAMRNSTERGEDVKAEVDKLIAEGTPYLRAGNTGEARRRMALAFALLRGLPWNEKEEYLTSLLLRTDSTVTDPARPLFARLAQCYPARYESVGGLRLHVWLAEAAPDGKLVREIDTFQSIPRDLIDEPLRFDANLDGVAEGSYRLVAEVLDGETAVGRTATPIHLVRDLETRRTAIEQRLGRIQGHEGAKATIRYPFDLARSINLGRREMARFDFPAEIRRSAELLAALESGLDSLLRAKGDHERHYWFAEAREIMPYRVYVPASWDGRAKLPMAVVLHGLGQDQDHFLDRDGGLLAKLAEQHGYLVVTPLGYRTIGWYGSVGGRRVVDPAQRRVAELSEKDVVNVVESVASEYGVDRSRIFLIGHSMGGAGTWYLGAKYADRWAGMAPVAAPFSDPDYPFDRLMGMPVIVCHGDADTLVPAEISRIMVRRMKEHGLDPVHVEVKGATHNSVVGQVLPQVFNFFDQHPRSFRANFKPVVNKSICPLLFTRDLSGSSDHSRRSSPACRCRFA